MLRGVGIVVGLAAEARLARRLGVAVAVGGGDAAGARRAAESLLRHGVRALVSFGLAGGLDPALPSGALLVPGAVWSAGRRIAVDPALAQVLGGAGEATLLCADRAAVTAAEKQRLWRQTGCAAVDLESGAVAAAAAAAGAGFAVLRAVCDPAGQDLPPAALAALDRGGAIRVGRVAASVLADPGQVPALMGLAVAAAAARRSLALRVAALRARGLSNSAEGDPEGEDSLKDI